MAEEEANLDDYSKRADSWIDKMNNELQDVKQNILELETSTWDLREKERILKEMRDKTSFKRGKLQAKE